mmetsp:Transcript_42092/g.103795  ORF Transcript_42092/g.103795 Transcript_42092/m.103795 type:complete len:244 (-) Transcript_42092:2821-3552(-)
MCDGRCVRARLAVWDAVQVVQTLVEHFARRPLYVAHAATLVRMHKVLDTRVRDHRLEGARPRVCLVAVPGERRPGGQWLQVAGGQSEFCVAPGSSVRSGACGGELLRGVDFPLVGAVHVVHFGGRVERRLHPLAVASEEHGVDCVVPQHARVVLISHLILPRSEAAAAPDVHLPQRVVRLVHVHIPLNVGHGVAVLQALRPDRLDPRVRWQHGGFAQAVQHLGFELVGRSEARSVFRLGNLNQ